MVIAAWVLAVLLAQEHRLQSRVAPSSAAVGDTVEVLLELRGARAADAELTDDLSTVVERAGLSLQRVLGPRITREANGEFLQEWRVELEVGADCSGLVPPITVSVEELGRRYASEAHHFEVKPEAAPRSPAGRLRVEPERAWPGQWIEVELEFEFPGEVPLDRVRLLDHRFADASLFAAGEEPREPDRAVALVIDPSRPLAPGRVGSGGTLGFRVIEAGGQVRWRSVFRVRLLHDLAPGGLGPFRCALEHRGSDGWTVVSAESPQLEVLALPPVPGGRPWSGAFGEIELKWLASAVELAAGARTELRLEARGAARTLADLVLPVLPPHAGARVREWRDEHEPGVHRRVFEVEKLGGAEVRWEPLEAVSWSEEGRWLLARTEPLRLVEAAPSPSKPALERADPQTPEDPVAGSGPGGAFWSFLGGLALGVVATSFLLWRRSRRRPQTAAVPASPDAVPPDAVPPGAAAPLERGVDEDADSLVRRVESELASRAGVSRASIAGDPWREQLPGLGAVSPELLEEAGSLQEELERARFARAPFDLVSLRTRTGRWLDAVRATLDPARGEGP